MRSARCAPATSKLRSLAALPGPSVIGSHDTAPCRTVRVDAWLWAARFFRTRALARQAIERGRVTLADAACKPAHELRIGDSLRIKRGEETFDVQVTGLAHKRGSAAVAQTLYRESEASIRSREEARAQRRAERAGYQPPPKRPDKRARRLIRALGDIDAR